MNSSGKEEKSGTTSHFNLIPSLVGIFLTFLGAFLAVLSFEANSTLDQFRIYGSAIFSIFGGAILLTSLVFQQRGFSLKLTGISKSIEILLSQNENDTFKPLRSLKGWSEDKHYPFHIREASRMFDDIIEGKILGQVNMIEDAIHNPLQELIIRDHSPIYEILYGMSKNLPFGGVWAGITRLEREHGWKKPVIQAFDDLKKIYRQRARNNEVSILRLYYFSSLQAFNSMSDEMRREAEVGISVRYLIGTAFPPDISILWEPGKKTDSCIKIEANDSIPLETIKQNGMLGLCALQFDTREGALLTKIELFGKETDQFNKRANIFSEFWQEAMILGHL